MDQAKSGEVVKALAEVDAALAKRVGELLDEESEPEGEKTEGDAAKKPQATSQPTTPPAQVTPSDPFKDPFGAAPSPAPPADPFGSNPFGGGNPFN